jgi:hypothetical protein
MTKKTFKTAQAIRKKAVVSRRQSTEQRIFGHERDVLTETGQELWLGKAFCKVPSGRVCCCGAVERVQSGCNGCEDCAWIELGQPLYAAGGLGIFSTYRMK